MTAETIIQESQVDYRIGVTAKLSRINYTQEGIEAVVEKAGVTYPITVTPSFGSEIVNPDVENAVELAYGKQLPSPNPNAPVSLLVGLQANGRCGADCKGCVFANHRVGDAMAGGDRIAALARPVDPETMADVIALGKELIYGRRLVENGQTIRLNALLSGDPSFTPYTGDLIRMVASDPDISASRWSTIAAMTNNRPLDAFVSAAQWYYNESHNNPVVAAHKPRFQVSLQSTNYQCRVSHVGHYRGGVFPDLIPTYEIASTFYEIKQLTGYSSTASFVLHKNSWVNSRTLVNELPPDFTIISLRPIIPTDDDSTKPMRKDSFRRLYSGFREKGYTVVVMPPIGLEMDNIHAKQFHRSLAA